MAELDTTPATPKLTEAVPGPLGGGAAEFKVNRGRIVVGAGVGILLSLAGIAVLVGVLESGSNRLWGLLGFGLLLAGGCVLVLVKVLASLRLWVSPQGFVVATLGKGHPGRCFRIESLEPTGAGRTPADRTPGKGKCEQALPNYAAARQVQTPGKAG
jgi:hypothetical protein